MNLLQSTLDHEGFRSKPYKDHLGNWTFGHGLTFITIEESITIVEGRLKDFQDSLINAKGWITGHPPIVLDVLTEMAYQMGLQGVLNFKNMWQALDDGKYIEAADHGLDSKWAKQTPERANQLMNIIRGLA